MSGQGQKHPALARMAARVVMNAVSTGQIPKSEAVPMFEQLYNAKAERRVKKVNKFLKQWGKPTDDDANLADAPRSGRPSPLTEEAVQQLLPLIKKGTRLGSLNFPGPTERRLFSGIEDAMRHSPAVNELVEQAGVQPRTVLARLFAADPNLVWRSVDVKRQFTAQQLQDRQACARALLALHPSAISNTTFIDCATFYLRCSHLQQWVLCDEEEFQDHPPKTLPPEALCLKGQLRVIAAVHPVLGLVWLDFVSGTTDIQRSDTFKATHNCGDEEPRYKVST